MAAHALFIGVNKYADRNIRELLCARRDASELYHLFKRELGYGDNAHLLEAPRVEDVYDQLEAIGQRVRAGDTFVLYFAGHGYEPQGGDDQFLLLSGARLALLKQASGGAPAGTLSVRDLVITTDAWPQVGRVLVFDACRSELMPTHGLEGMPVFGSDRVLQRLASRDMGLDVGTATPAGDPRPGTVAIARTPVIIKACQSGQLAVELLDHGRSVFGKALDDALKSARQVGRAVLTDGGLLDAVAQRMAHLAGAAGQSQKPWMNAGAPEVLLYQPEALAWAVLLRGFEDQLAAGRLTEPFGDCARDTLSHMNALGLPNEKQVSLLDRLNQSQAEQQRQRDADHDQALISDAELLNTDVEWSQVRLLARLPESKALAMERLRELRRKPPALPGDEADRAAERRRLEDADFDATGRQDTPAAWSAFLGRWPPGEGQHYDEAVRLKKAAEARAAADAKAVASARAASKAKAAAEAKAATQVKIVADSERAAGADGAADAANVAKAKLAEYESAARARAQGVAARPDEDARPAESLRKRNKVIVATAITAVSAVMLVGLWTNRPNSASVSKPAVGTTENSAVTKVKPPSDWLSPLAEKSAETPPQGNVLGEKIQRSANGHATGVGSSVDSTSSLSQTYRRSRSALLSSAWWAPDRVADGSSKPPTPALARLLDDAERAAAAGVPEALLDIGQVRAFGHGRPADPEQAARDLLAWMQQQPAPSAQDRDRAAEALDHALDKAIRGRPGGDWAPLARTAASLPANWPREYWQGVIQRCLQRPPDQAAATAALQRMVSSAHNFPSDNVYRTLASSHLRCLKQGQGCGAACSN